MYKLEITETQAKVISRSLEVFSRLGIGQVNMAIEEAHFEKLFLGEKGESVESHLKRKEDLRYHCDAIKKILTGSEWNAFGISAPEISDNFRVAYDIKKVIDHQLYKERNPEESLSRSVNSYPPTYSLGREPLPVISKENI